ncbi:MAG: hypothetical protein H8D46_03645, partial [FCB group bacterium]|nr:hypothetical protein [FCB group bacterium]
MKKLLIALSLLGAFIFSEDVILTVTQADVGSIVVEMNNTEAVYGFQFDVVADEQFAPTAFGYAAGVGTALAQGFIVQTSNSGRVIGFSLAGASIPAGSGTLVEVTWDPMDVEGYVTLDIANIAGEGGGPLSFATGDPYLENDDLAPLKYSLGENYPNPFNPITTIGYSIPEAGAVQLIVYDVLGREVKTLVSEYMVTNTYSVLWHGT